MRRMKTKADILNVLKEQLAGQTGLSVPEIEDDATFYSLGLDSVSAVYLLDRLEKKLQIEMNPLFFWDYPTVAQLAEHLSTLSHHE